jgi:SMODS and SLOG-associating 2TM effector domain 1
MTERAQERAAELSRFYERYRIVDQQRFYASRRKEYERAGAQLATVTTGLLLLAATAGVLGSAEVWLPRGWWGIIAAACSALAATASSWGTLIGFEENARLYRAAHVALDPLRGPLEDRPGDRRMLLQVVVRAEEVLQAETSQWGQHLQRSAATIAPQDNRPAQDQGAAGDTRRDVSALDARARQSQPSDADG